jgi:hypothetical protein
MASALHRHPFNLVGNESSLAMRPAEYANSREFGAKFSLFLRGENDVSAVDPACKKEVRWVARPQNGPVIGCFGRDAARSVGDDVHFVAVTHRMDSGIARHISVQSAAMASFFRPVFFTASTTRRSSQQLMKVGLIVF